MTTVDLFQELNEDERAALAGLARELLAKRPGPTPLHQVRPAVRAVLSRANTFEQAVAKPRERLANLVAKRDEMAALPDLNQTQRMHQRSHLGQLQSQIDAVLVQIGEHEQRRAAALAELEPMAGDIARLDAEWTRCQPAHDKARQAVLRKLVAGCEDAVKDATKAGQKSSTVEGFRAAADRLEAAVKDLEVHQARLAELGKVGARDWR